jgi:hypothetical protein
MKRRTAILIATVTLASGLAFARNHEPADPRIASVKRIFVAGNNQAAESVRSELLKGNACFNLVGKAADADAVLEVTGDSQTQGDAGFGAMGGRNWIASATLTLASGDLVWSKSERFTDAPFHSGGKVAGSILVKDLARDANCKK